MQFEMESLKKKLEKITNIVQQHVQAVMPRLDTGEKNYADLQERLKAVEAALAKLLGKGKKRGEIDLTDIVEEHDNKLDQLVAIVQVGDSVAIVQVGGSRGDPSPFRTNTITCAMCPAPSTGHGEG